MAEHAPAPVDYAAQYTDLPMLCCWRTHGRFKPFALPARLPTWRTTGTTTQVEDHRPATRRTAANRSPLQRHQLPGQECNQSGDIASWTAREP